MLDIVADIPLFRQAIFHQQPCASSAITTMKDEAAVASVKEPGTDPLTLATKQATSGSTIPVEASSLERLVSRHQYNDV